MSYKVRTVPCWRAGSEQLHIPPKIKYTLITGELKSFRPNGWIGNFSVTELYSHVSYKYLGGKKRIVRVMLPMATQASTQWSCCRKRIFLLCFKEAPSPQASSREGDLHSPDKYSLLQKSGACEHTANTMYLHIQQHYLELGCCCISSPGPCSLNHRFHSGQL